MHKKCRTRARKEVKVVEEVFEAEEALRQYVALQKKMSGLLFEKYGAPKDRFLANVPPSGMLTLEECAWSFQKHGVGVTFTDLSNGVVVNAHQHIECCPECFDTWRLAIYFESRNVRALNIGSSVYDAEEEESLAAMLTKLVELGQVAYFNKIKAYTLSD